VTAQLAFDIPPLAALRRADFFAAPSNAAALAAVENWQDWPAGKLLLIGPAGAGKTHLAHIWADMVGAEFVAAADLAGADLPGLAAAGAVVVEEAQTIAGDAAAETALFHLHNLLQGGGRLLITATAPPRDWRLTLPDLQSRLQALSIARIDAPDDALLSAVLIKLFADRQISVPPSLIPYLLARMDRSFAAARDLVARLDARALAQGRPVTRALAAEMLDRDQAR
jgi:chromosomal replication initiation ATPase DnaA